MIKYLLKKTITLSRKLVEKFLADKIKKIKILEQNLNFKIL